MSVRFGRYELLRRLGRGGMAEVFLARYRGPESFEKRLVIKRVLPERSRDRAFLKLFFEEARLHVSLSHGNLVPVFDFGRVGNLYFIAMEYVPGTDLAAILQRSDGKLTPPQVAYLGVELCRGLGYVHRRGLVHRDVTPRNVLLSTEGEVKLSDFGVALASESTAKDGLRGTLAYMAPEQARGEALDGRADLYSLGLVLAEALTGKRVRSAREGEDAAAAAASTAALALDGALGEVINRAAAPAPADRFADADAMLAALEAAQKTLSQAETTPARALAGRVLELTAAPPEEAVDAEASLGPATYFRDAPTVAEGMEQLQRTLGETGPTRSRAYLAIVLLLLGALAIGGGRLLLRHRPLQLPPPSPLDLATLPTIDLAPPAVSLNDLTPPPTPPDPTPRKHVMTPPRAESGSVRVQCTPWCVPLVDGVRRGDGARLHVLELPAGKHRLGAQRLDDKQEREIEVQPRHAQSIDFTFQ